ncbi:NDP-sugar epimerase, includes UDP-GlcNAc-inverting 4,6-dehydratase FlaA1 and capsular polysaccharide biosynthesis protein EpsC [Desulfuromusa kysingii]|uniref:NDP-sugar epimerase, includes UDP-GlcNAc-inverting 4,6-dehydratase FlaA1 and capsular polysaccharide biosynthesis protein EpsC n=1 Tax=Desulfuromusa kysingii TaxID=37625 RepID=A0A1H3YI81_9BACT|nr:nucleoside-diphosphate sugar epimerase/dehydratase [Desulfuromusa kysingii]SEA11319.1 NDP-sugar epimerase, includes UDP-GlcNAc-inverting 4,6-dehydratase FlaA1 and capsular polysaccharide biosynthesis protein EpsC [Desulfuromusa kysingii]
MKEIVYRNRLFVVFVMTSLIIISSFLFAYAIRFDFSIPSAYWPRITTLIPVILAIKLIVFWKFGCFRGWWRYVSMPDLLQIVKANILSSSLVVVYAVAVYRLEQVPRSVLLLDGIFCFLAVGGIRFATRALRENYLPVRQGTELRQARALIVGAGDAGQLIAREIRSNPQLDLNILGFIDDDPVKKKGAFQGLNVLGSQADLKKLVNERGVDEVIIAIPSASGKVIKSIVERCRETKVKFRILPGVGELIDGRVSIQQVRDVDLNDLLGREPIFLDEAQINNYLRGKRVLVSGAGGSIGSEICRQLARFKPQKLILFENAETPLFLIEQELIKNYPDLTIVPIIGDVRNHSRVNVIFDEQMPQVVFHAAAYKHVPMMENNPAEAVNNNISGTRLLADAADKIGVEKFVMISTDKAVRPTNIMGTTKRVAEMYVQALNLRSKTSFVTTRFGNVLGSNGSVIPTFKKQIANGGPVTVTHPDVTRFFMTIPEATQLVLQAGSMGSGGEIYLFNMGEAVKIQFLAEELIRLSGLQPHDDIDIVYTGLRPGEKLYEELLLDEEGVLPTPHNKICIAQSTSIVYSELLAMIESLLASAKALDLPAVREKLQQLVPEYCPAENRPLAKVIPFSAIVMHQ